MAADGSEGLITSMGNDGECSETTVEIKIKTLDSQTHTLRVNRCVSVPALKEQIATVTGVLSEQQRLICRGKVLKDDQLLSAYHVEDGHTLHLVARQPSLPGFPGSDPTMASQDPATNTSRNRATQVAHRVVLGTFNVAEQGDGFMPDLNRIVSAVLSTIGLGGPASEGVGVLREYVTERAAEMSSTDGGLDMAHVLPEDVTLRNPLRGSSRVSAVSFGPHPAVIPDSLLTLSQYISHLEHDFDLNVRDYGTPFEPSGAQNVDRVESNATVRQNDGQSLMPTPASLAEVMLSARQLLIGQAAECLSLLTGCLESQASVTNGEERVRIQSSAMRSGALIQNLGALMLELGRTIMTLRMGNLPNEAVVNAGPAVFISRSGPNPIMVQPLPFQPGASLGPASLANGGGLSGGPPGSGMAPRNIDIRIHAGSLMPGLSANHSGQDSSNQAIPSRPSGTSTGQNSNGLTGETTTRILPIQSMVTALPASGSRTSDTATGGSGVGLFYPLLARFQHLPSNVSSNERNNNAPNSGENNTGVADGSVFGNVSPVFTSGSFTSPNQQGLSVSSSANAIEERSDTPEEHRTFQPQFSNRFDELLHTLFPVEQVHMAVDNAQIRPNAASSSEVLSGVEDGAAAGLQEAPTPGNDGVFFSNLLRQIMPIISRTVSETAAGSSTAPGSTSQTQLDNSSQRGSSQDRSDPPSSPHPKRQKTQ